MSTNHDSTELDAVGVPELTPLGERIELLRIERRMSKGVLAQRAGTSRQQLWRVMTGKSELTTSLCARLAEVLEIDSRLLRDAQRAVGPNEPTPLGARRAELARAFEITDLTTASTIRDATVRRYETFEEYIAGAHGLEHTFETLPPCEAGRRLKRALLNAVEDIADARALRLPPAFFDLRRRVVNAER